MHVPILLALVIPLFLLLSPSSVNGQPPQDLDSMLNVIRAQPVDTIRMRMLKETGDVLTDQGRIDEAKALYHQALDIALHVRDRKWERIVLNRLGIAHFY